VTTEGKVSPLPWRVDPQHRADIQTVDGRDIGTLWHEEAVGMTLVIRGVMAAKEDADGAANAAFIVRAVNAHDRLVAALELILHSFDDGPPSLQSIRLDDACESARELLDALAAAKEG